MSSKGKLSLIPSLRFRLVAGVHLLWLVMICLLAAWWGRLMLQQAARIAELENQLGLSLSVTQSHWHRIQRMLYWESTSFFVLLLACTGLLLWLYWRDSQRARGLQAFFASVTHELRTPLSSIRLQSESIADHLSSDHSVKHLVQRLLEDAIRLEGQVERTLELARVEGGGPVYVQPLEFKPWLDRFLKRWSNDYENRVELESCLHLDDFLIQADPVALQVIFRNLLENSVKHSKLEKVKISLSTQIFDKGVSFVLKDNGKGYEGQKNNLGQIFQKGASSQGTGVGLYLVKVLMKQMGGCADLGLEVGSGFGVSLWFPEVKLHG